MIENGVRALRNRHFQGVLPGQGDDAGGGVNALGDGLSFGQDVGQLGDVNQGFAGLQEKHGVLRVTDAGIREATILGQAIGMAMRGLRPRAARPSPPR